MNEIKFDKFEASRLGDDDFEDLSPKWKERRRRKEEKAAKDWQAAREVTDKFLMDNPDVNVGYVIERLKSSILSTHDCCVKLKISHGAFRRLRKKYKIEPVYTADRKNTLKQIHPHIKKAALLSVKNFYTHHQIERIPQEEIAKIQMRSARSLGFPKGQNVPLEWRPRGVHSNGKLMARTDILEKFKIKVSYDSALNKYLVKSSNDTLLMSKKEVDLYNLKISKLKSFI